MKGLSVMGAEGKAKNLTVEDLLRLVCSKGFLERLKQRVLERMEAEMNAEEMKPVSVTKQLFTVIASSLPYVETAENWILHPLTMFESEKMFQPIILSSKKNRKQTIEEKWPDLDIKYWYKLECIAQSKLEFL